MTWHERARCAGSIQPEMFTAEELTRDLALAGDVVKGYCDACPVWRECYDWALTEEHFEGVAGGYIWGPKVIRRPGKRAIPRNMLKRPRPVAS